MTSLKGKIVFVTGATSGIGKGCVIEFAKAGADILICARREELLKEFADQLKNEFKVDVHYFQLDVRKKDDVFTAIKNLPAKWKSIDVLLNNAGLARGLSKMYEDDIQNWEEMIDTNIKGLLYVTRAVAPLMAERKSGHIINIGSIAGHEAYPKGGVYCGTKHAVDAITKSLRMDLVEDNVRVSTIDPGLVETNFSSVRFRGDEERAKNVYKGFKPLTGNDIGEIAVFIASRPAHVNLAEAIVLPSAQASATIVNRK